MEGITLIEEDAEIKIPQACPCLGSNKIIIFTNNQSSQLIDDHVNYFSIDVESVSIPTRPAPTGTHQGRTGTIIQVIMAVPVTGSIIQL